MSKQVSKRNYRIELMILNLILMVTDAQNHHKNKILMIGIDYCMVDFLVVVLLVLLWLS